MKLLSFFKTLALFGAALESAQANTILNSEK